MVWTRRPGSRPRSRVQAGRLGAASILCLVLTLPACCIKTMAIKTVADSLSEGTSSFATDDDPQLVKEALPFGLKTLEGLLAQLPTHRPLLRSVAAAFEIDPIHLGAIFLVNLELGYLTPPVGMNLFLSSFRFNTPMPRVIRAVLPFMLVQLTAVLLVTFVPWLSVGFAHWWAKTPGTAHPGTEASEGQVLSPRPSHRSSRPVVGGLCSLYGIGVQLAVVP